MAFLYVNSEYGHLTLGDIKESINELQYYKDRLWETHRK